MFWPVVGMEDINRPQSSSSLQKWHSPIEYFDRNISALAGHTNLPDKTKQILFPLDCSLKLLALTVISSVLFQSQNHFCPGNVQPSSPTWSALSFKEKVLQTHDCTTRLQNITGEGVLPAHIGNEELELIIIVILEAHANFWPKTIIKKRPAQPDFDKLPAAQFVNLPVRIGQIECWKRSFSQPVVMQAWNYKWLHQLGLP